MKNLKFPDCVLFFCMSLQMHITIRDPVLTTCALFAVITAHSTGSGL